MLDARDLSVGHFQSLHSFFYNYRVRIYRRSTAGTPFQGIMGTNSGGTGSYQEVTRDWPIAIAPGKGLLENFPEGQTALADYGGTCQYKTLADGSLILMPDDIIWDIVSNTKWLVLFSVNAGGANKQIIVALKAGQVTETLPESP